HLDAPARLTHPGSPKFGPDSRIKSGSQPQRAPEGGLGDHNLVVQRGVQRDFSLVPLWPRSGATPQRSKSVVIARHQVYVADPLIARGGARSLQRVTNPTVFD